ncbi:DUF541 domain-containing protein [Streptomyces sp. AJS327]|uniref:SIMPL domain-containing protein n=1 Tax=Streptomyces sp. AJS327 TaxID=2545265 RepID=UPI0015DF1595|nr:SIMPL domain-containing protein [Streptomyces sp. AJS327]MBA0050397.1 DUF541 domain-containing protein [Streptomyces sp. AJS327]
MTSISTGPDAPAQEPASGPHSYGTPEVPKLMVKGEAEFETDPETARLSVTVSSRGPDRRGALEDLNRRNSQVLDLTREYGEAVEKVETGSLTVRPELSDRGRKERVRAHLGTVRLTVTVQDFTVLGELTGRLADLELTTVNGPWWGLRPRSAAHREARQLAVREAVSRGRELAEALGSELTALLELTDTGGGGTSPPPPPAPGMTRSAYAGAPEPAPAFDLEPQRQTVTARVSARFAISPPRL